MKGTAKHTISHQEGLPSFGCESKKDAAGKNDDTSSLYGTALENGEGVKEKDFLYWTRQAGKEIAQAIRKAVTWIILLPIRFYRSFLSPMKAPCCKFYPTCSTYALTAVSRFGPIKGGWLAVRRVLRCHPWSLGGMDPVPEEYHFFHGKKLRN